MRDLDSVAVLRQIVSEMRDKDCAGPFTIGTWADRIETAIQSQQDGAQGGEAVAEYAATLREAWQTTLAAMDRIPLSERKPAIAPQATPAAVAGFFDVSSGRAVTVDRHDWPEHQGFQNVWIVRATEPAALAPQPAQGE